MHKAVCPGSFDPVTNGHLDILSRASKLYDEVVRRRACEQVQERDVHPRGAHGDGARDHRSSYGNVVVESFGGLLVDFCRERGIQVIVKGLRAVSDFDYELQMAQMNHSLDGVETLFLSTNPLYSFLSSSLVKEVATYGGDVSGLVPPTVLKRLTERLQGD